MPSPEKRSSLVVLPLRGFRRELEQLYARRSAIETLIESLERYERSQMKTEDQRKRKSA